MLEGSCLIMTSSGLASALQTDERAHRLMRHATSCGGHKFLRLLVTLESADLVPTDEEGFKGFDLGRMDLSPIRPLKVSCEVLWSWVNYIYIGVS